MKSWLLIFLLLVPAYPQPKVYAGYPVIDIPDLVFDILDMIEKIVVTAKEVESYHVQVMQLKHYYEQAERLADGGAEIDRFLIKSFEFYMQGEIIDQFWSYDDADLQQFVALYDGTRDLKSQLNQLKSKYDKVFAGPKSVDSWQTGEYSVDAKLKEAIKKRQGQIETIRSGIGQALGWVGETKYAHEEDSSAYTLTDDIWKDFQTNEDDDRGRELGYDLINGDLSVLREVQLKRMRMLQSFQTLRGLEGASRIQQMDRQLSQAKETLEMVNGAIDALHPVSDQIF